MMGTTKMTKIEAEIWTHGKPLSEMTAIELSVKAQQAWNIPDIEKLTALRGEAARRGIRVA